jgi:formylglycine-generating enzyme required for sulfatase activity
MRLSCALIPFVLAGCDGALPPRGEVVLYVTTDAPLPAPADDPSYVIKAPALFDRLRIEVFPPGATTPCAGCTRELAIDSRIVADGKASVGLVPKPETTGHRVRVRLFRSLGREPRAASTIETVATLPVVHEEGIVEATVILRVDDVARPRGTLDAPVETDPGPAPKNLPGTWAGAIRNPCVGDAMQGEICVPSGAFWMGNPNVDYVGPEADGALERLVILSPFWLDEHEVTVADMRAFKPVALDDPHRPGPSWEACTYTTMPDANEALPVNCLTWQLAQEVCAKAKKRLPTEAEHEYAQGALESRPHPWGEDPPLCPDAVAQRDGTTCPGTLPEIAGWGKRDRVAIDVTIGGPQLVDLAGNVAEWVADGFQFQDEPCWGIGVFTNPLCKKSARLADAHSFRGGAFDEDASFLHTSLRRNVVGKLGVSHAIGFRCARNP